jgi:hypothetical protein
MGKNVEVVAANFEKLPILSSVNSGWKFCEKLLLQINIEELHLECTITPYVVL